MTTANHSTHQEGPGSPSSFQREVSAYDALLCVLEVVFCQIRLGPGEALAATGLVALRARLAAAAREQRSLEPLRQAALELVAQLGDPHTRLCLGHGGSRRLPFRVRQRRSRGNCTFVVADTESDDAPPEGAEVTHWNGKPIRCVLSDLERFVPHAASSARREQALSLLTDRPLSPLPAQEEEWVQLRYRCGRAAVPCSHAEWSGRWLSGEIAAAPRRRAPEEGAVELLDRDEGWALWRSRHSRADFAVLELAAIPPQAEAKALVARLQCKLRATGLARVLLDLRGNCGGEISSVETLLRLFRRRHTASLYFQFRDTHLLRRLLGQHPRWRHAAEPGDGYYLAAHRLCAPCPRRSYDGPRAECLAVLVDERTFSAAEILAHLARISTGAPVFGPRRGTLGGTVNAWTYPALQTLAPNQLLPMPATSSQRERRGRVERWAARHWAEARVVEVDPGRRWWVESGSTELNARGCDVEWTHSEWAGAKLDSNRSADALVVFDARRPVIPDLPLAAGFQCGIRRAVVETRQGVSPLGPVDCDFELRNDDERVGRALWEWVVKQRHGWEGNATTFASSVSPCDLPSASGAAPSACSAIDSMADAVLCPEAMRVV